MTVPGEKLRSCAKAGNAEELRKLLKSRKKKVKSLLNESDFAGWTALHEASHKGFLEVVQCLLSFRATVDCKNKQGGTPLSLACIEGHLGVVECLISAGAKVGHDALHVVSYNGYLDVAKCLVASGANVNDTDSNNETPLHRACVNGHVDIVKYLLSKGATIDCVNNHGQSPMDQAADETICSVLQKELIWRRRRQFLLFLAFLRLKPLKGKSNESDTSARTEATWRVFASEDMQRTIAQFL